MVLTSGGIFDVDVDGERVFSKREAGRHAAPGEVVGLIHLKKGTRAPP
jgi:selenoprotein W-related protein